MLKLNFDEGQVIVDENGRIINDIRTKKLKKSIETQMKKETVRIYEKARNDIKRKPPDELYHEGGAA